MSQEYLTVCCLFVCLFVCSPSQTVCLFVLPHRLFGHTGACNACGQSIPASEMVMRAQGNVYHLKVSLKMHIIKAT